VRSVLCGMAPDFIAPADRRFASEGNLMNIGYLAAIRWRAAALGLLALAVALMETVGLVSADPQRGQSATNPRPAQPSGNPNALNPYSAAYGQGRYTPYPVKDPTAAERAVIAGRAYKTTLDDWVQRAMAPPGPAGGPPDQDALFSLELVERLGKWSLRLQEAQDNEAKSSAARYQALSNHLGRMSSLEDGRFLREAVKPGGLLLKGQPVAPKPPRSFAEIARFFRPVDKWGIDRVVPAVVEFERPLNPVGIAVTPAERVETAGRAFAAILHAAVDRFLAPPRAGEARHDPAAIFDAPLAERLANWSDMWRQAQDDAATDTPSRSAVARNGPARLALAGTRLAGPDALPATVKSHIERMTALETGRFLDDALNRAGHSAGEPLDMTRLPEFVAITRFFRIEAESQLPDRSWPKGTDISAPSRAAAAGQIYHAILDGAARRYLAFPRAGAAPPEARSVFDTSLAERLGSWSTRWGRVHARAGEGPGSRFTAVRSHLERMTSLEDGRVLHDALARAGRPVGVPDASPPPREFSEVARFFRLEARWELELIKSR
jgi:hypothetical protein